jgi:predicted DsbA family dithiol-disulfide isomerase
VGLDAVALRAALEQGLYLPRLQEIIRQARTNGFTAAPTFVIEGYGPISGAQPTDTFRAILRGLENGASPEPLASMG